MLWDSSCFGGIKINIKQLYWYKKIACISFVLSLCSKIFGLLPMVSKICSKSSQQYSNARLGTGWGSLFLYLFPSSCVPSPLAYVPFISSSPFPHLLIAQLASMAPECPADSCWAACPPCPPGQHSLTEIWAQASLLMKKNSRYKSGVCVKSLTLRAP